MQWYAAMSLTSDKWTGRLTNKKMIKNVNLFWSNVRIFLNSFMCDCNLTERCFPVGQFSVCHFSKPYLPKILSFVLSQTDFQPFVRFDILKVKNSSSPTLTPKQSTVTSSHGQNKWAEPLARPYHQQWLETQKRHWKKEEEKKKPFYSCLFAPYWTCKQVEINVWTLND